MAKSRKGKHRRKTRHQRHLRQKYLRQKEKQKPHAGPSGVQLGSFFRRYKIEMLFLLVMVFVVAGILLLRPDRKAVQEMSNAVSSLIEDGSEDRNEAYPYGYKIIALRDRDIIDTTYDTLPDDLRINWKNISIVRLRTVQGGNEEDKIMLEIPDIDYAPGNVSGMTIKTSLIPRKGASEVLKHFGDREFVVEIVENKDNQIFLLLGLR